MIPVRLQPIPVGFDFQHEVFERGEDTIRQLAGLSTLRKWRGRKLGARVASVREVTPEMLRDHPHWTRALDALHSAYDGYCAYLARYIEPVETPTVDHFVALRNSTDPMLAYTWSNYRLASSLMNGCKSAFDDVLDPFEIEHEWFALDLNTFRVVAGPKLPAARLAEANATIHRLHLDDKPICESRRRAFHKYWSPPAGKRPVPLWSLREDEPFLEYEMRRQNRIRPEDTE